MFVLLSEFIEFILFNQLLKLTPFVDLHYLNIPFLTTSLLLEFREIENEQSYYF